MGTGPGNNSQGDGRGTRDQLTGRGTRGDGIGTLIIVTLDFVEAYYAYIVFGVPVSDIFPDQDICLWSGTEGV